MLGYDCGTHAHTHADMKACRVIHILQCGVSSPFLLTISPHAEVSHCSPECPLPIKKKEKKLFNKISMESHLLVQPVAHHLSLSLSLTEPFLSSLLFQVPSLLQVIHFCLSSLPPHIRCSLVFHLHASFILTRIHRTSVLPSGSNERNLLRGRSQLVWVHVISEYLLELINFFYLLVKKLLEAEFIQSFHQKKKKEMIKLNKEPVWSVQSVLKRRISSSLFKISLL